MFHLRNLVKISTKLYTQPVHTIIKHRQLFRTSAIVSKFVKSDENDFAHGILKNNPKCRVLRGEHNANVDEYVEFDFNQNWSDLTTDDIVECLRRIGSFCERNGTTISDERFDRFVDVCTKRCFDFTDNQLIQSLQILIHYPPTESQKSRNFVELWTAFDNACVERIGTWDFNKILYVCDHWHMLRLGKFNEFNYRASLKVGKKLRNLPPHQLVQMMFYLNLKRTQILDMLEIERNLMNSMDSFTLNEIAVVCMGFFKTQTRLKTPGLVESIIKRLIREIDTVEDIPLTCILKALRFSCNLSHISLIRELLDAANGQLPRLTLLSCLHVALLGTHLHICHQNCIEQILRRFSDDVKSIRMKDFERISYVIGFFDFESESKIENRLCQQILTELKNQRDDIVKYPQCFTLCLHYLTMKGYYDEELITTALSVPFLKLAYGNQTNYGKDLFSLDSYVKINLKETYTGNELTEKNRRYMGKMLTQSIPDRNDKHKVNATDNILLQVKDLSDELCTHSYLAYALPHFDRPDILIAYDKRSNTGIDITHNLPQHYSGKIMDRSMLIEGLNVDAANVEIVNIIVCGWSNYVRDTQKMTGFTRQKVEQSKILGLRPVLIPYYDWTRLHLGERKLYVKYKINSAVRDK